MQNEFHNRYTAQERKYQQELLDAKSLQLSLEDRISSNKDELSRLKAEIESWRTQSRHLEESKKLAVQEQERLRNDLKNMQQSVAASFRIDTSLSTSSLGAGTLAGMTNSPTKAISTSSTNLNALQRTSLPSDMEAALKLHDAKYEAKLRQMNNKVDFLKSQLESERKSCDEMKNALEDSQRVVNEIREDYERKMEKIHYENEKKILEHEERVRDSYEQRMVELTTLQRNFYSLQNQSQEMGQENLLLKQREESLQASLAKSQVQQMALRTEVDQLKAQLNVFQSAKEEEMKKDSNKLNQEAVLRRLDNERHYLKNQLTSEITLKNELQNVLQNTQQQLQETQRQWQDDVNVLKEKMTTMKRDSQEKEQRLQATISQLDHDLKHVKTTNNELKDGFIKTRDSLRMEQLAIEKLNHDKARLLETVKDNQEEIERLKQYERETKEHFERQIESLNALMIEQDSSHKTEITRMKGELQKQFMVNSQAAVELMKVKDEMDRETIRVNKKI